VVATVDEPRTWAAWGLCPGILDGTSADRRIALALTRTFSRIALAGMLALVVASPVLAGGAVRSTIEVTGIGDTETFITTGGVVCPDGWAVTTFEKFGGGGAAGSFHGFKTLYCNDGSGSFRITFDAATKFGTPQDQGGWHVIDGTDAYATLVGGGNLVGTYIEGGIVDLYTGRLSR
jgi:hypothetical protein